MYQRARKYDELICDNPRLLMEYAPEELEAYTVAMNSLALVDLKNAWFLMRGSANEAADQVSKGDVKSIRLGTHAF